MKITCKFLLLRGAVACMLATGLSAPAHGQEAEGRAFRIDDSGTVVIDPVLEMQWEAPGKTGTTSLVSASTRVAVQLNMAPWAGRAGRIYMSLPRSSGPTVRATWKTGGVLLPGSLISGERALVFAGNVTASVLRDLIDIELETDGARLMRPEALAFGFEIETDQ